MTTNGPAAVRKRSKTLERLLDAALDAFAAVGAAGATVEMICERAGFTRGAFYSNFANKDELVQALVRREFDRRIEPVTEPGRAPSAMKRVPADHDRLALVIAALLPEHEDDHRWVVLLSELRRYAAQQPASARLFADKQSELMSRLGARIATMAKEADVHFVVPATEVARIALAVYSESLADAILDDAAGRRSLDRNGLARRIAAVVNGLIETKGSGSS